jgi:DNA-binding transcriptional ArsR family regulator
MTLVPRIHLVSDETSDASEEAALDHVFSALSDPVRREILARLDGRDLLVSEIAAPFDISLQAVSRHIQVLVRAGLVTQERTGRISRCRLDAGPIFTAAVWLNRYSKYWQAQFDLIALSLQDIEEQRVKRRLSGRKRPSKSGRGAKAPARAKSKVEE